MWWKLGDTSFSKYFGVNMSRVFRLMWKYPMMIVILTLSGKCCGEVHNALLAIQKPLVIGP